VVYGQYTTAKGCVQALCVASRKRTALSHGILAIYHEPEVSYCYFKLVTNVIRAVKKNACFVIPVVYGVIYYGCQPISIQDWNHTVYI
jgi:hypothetical protein